MAEGLWRALGGERWDVFSAGTRPSAVRPEAVAVLAEAGIDIAAQRSKSVDEFVGRPIDLVITVCDHAQESCPVFPARAQRMHWPFPDPASVAGSDAQRLAAFREVRDALRARIAAYLQAH
jgi:arsenate reductase